MRECTSDFEGFVIDYSVWNSVNVIWVLGKCCGVSCCLKAVCAVKIKGPGAGQLQKGVVCRREMNLVHSGSLS